MIDSSAFCSFVSFPAMRTQTSQYTVSPHITSSERKSIHHSNAERRPRKAESWNGQTRRSNYSDSFETSEEFGPSASASMGMSPESDSIATSATEYSSSFFPDATFGESVFVAQRRRSNDDQLEFLERIERILRFAQKRLKKSRVEGFFEKKKRKNGNGSSDGGILHVQHSDVKLDSILGNGSYNVVYSVKRIKGNLLNPEDIVVKTLRSKLLTDLPMLAACAADLRKEGLLLAALQQQCPESSGCSTKSCRPMKYSEVSKCHGANHIVKCLAWAPTGLSAFANGCHDSFFLVLEKLDRTMTDMLKEWKALEKAAGVEQQSNNASARRSLRRSLRNSSRSLLLTSVKNSFFKADSMRQLDTSERSERDESTSSSSAYSNSNPYNSYGVDADQVRFWKLRLGLVMDLCGAISFLHSQRVIHRDLKPDNVGFDKTGRLKVFDFDVARVLPNQANWGDYKNETFKMTKKVGSPRYMSPEVARGEHYNEKTDVYALGLLAYELLSLKRPFDSLTSSDRGGKGGNVYKDCVQVVVRGEEPPEESVSGRRQKRRNSLGSFPFRRPNGSGDCSGGSSGKLGSMFRRRSHSRGSSKKNSRTRTAPKYANVRPLLPVATPQELAAEHRPGNESHLSPRKPSRSRSSKSSSCKSVPSSSIRSHHHAVNDIHLETTSFFWTRSLRTTIDQAWSYDIPTRPFASELKVLIGEELDRIEWLEEDCSNSSNN